MISDVSSWMTRKLKFHERTVCWFTPGLKSTIALWQANSAGSTCSALNRVVTSCRMRMSEWAWWPPDFPLPVEPPPDKPEVAVPPEWAGGRPPECATWSATAKSGEVSIGRLHWTAQSRNSSDHDSSSRITCHRRTTDRTSHPPDRRRDNVYMQGCSGKF